jgi:hypothetical protein
MDRIDRAVMAMTPEQQTKFEALTRTCNESTGLSWLWAFLFGWIWFLYIGNGKMALVSFVLTLFVVGLIVNPFLAYRAHRQVARREALNQMALSR